MIEANQRYEATVLDIKLTKSGNRGTPGVWIRFQVGNDQITDTRWITPKTKERIERELRAMGADANVIRTKEFWRKPNDFVHGAKVEIETESERGDDGKDRIRVKWINAVVREADEDTMSGVVAMFGEVSADPFAPSDEDVPF